MYLNYDLYGKIFTIHRLLNSRFKFLIYSIQSIRFLIFIIILYLLDDTLDLLLIDYFRDEKMIVLFF